MKARCKTCAYSVLVDKTEERELWNCIALDVQFGKLIAERCSCGKYEVKNNEKSMRKDS